MNKKKLNILLFLIALFALFIFVFIIPYIVKQNDFLKYDLESKKIEKVEYTVYDGEPFTSASVEKRSMSSSNVVEDFYNGFFDSSPLLYFHPKQTEKVLFIYFDDDTMLNAFVYKDALGLNYGKLWIKNPQTENLIKAMMSEDLVKPAK